MKTFSRATFSIYGLKLFLSALFLFAFMGTGYGQTIFQISTNEQVVIDFDTDMPNVNNGTYSGAGIQQNPTSGQLDSDSWAVFGAADGDVDFGGSGTGNSHKGGTSDGGDVDDGGLYAFNVSNGGTPDYAFGFQPSGTSFTGSSNPGIFKFRFENATGQNISLIHISYDIYLLDNSATRSTSINFSYAVNNDVSYDTVSSLIFSGGSGSSSSWSLYSRSATLDLTGSELLAGSEFYLKWGTDDSDGFLERDELAIDNIKITLIAPDQDSNIGQPISQVEGGLFSAGTDSDTPVEIFQFEVIDQGTSDNLPTKIQTIRLVPTENNEADWSDHLGGLFIFDNTSNTLIATSNINITDSYIDIEFEEDDFTIPNGETHNISVYIYSTGTDQVDKAILGFQMGGSSIGFQTYPSGSGFDSTLGTSQSNNFFIEVTATELAFTNSAIPNVCIGEVPTTVPVVQAQDANGNLDVDYNGTITLSTTPATGFEGSTNVGTASSGVATFSSLAFSESNAGVTLSASDGSLSSSTSSNSFDVILDEVTGFTATASNAQTELSWTNPTSCFTDVLILASENSISFEPVTGASYPHNVNYGVGDEVEPGVFAVYQGSESPQTITGLSNDTPYFFKIFTRHNGYWSAGTEISATPQSPVEGFVAWDFDDGNIDPESGDGTITASAGTGPEFFEGGLYYTSWNEDGDYYEIIFDATGRENLRLIFDHKSTDAGPVTFQPQYFDGSAFQDIGTPVALTSEYSNANIDLSAYSFLNNNATATVRLTIPTAAFDGNGRFYLDNIVVQGSIITPSQLLVTDINGGENIVAGTPFNITVQAQDENGIAANVIIDTEIQLSVATGSGSLSGTLTATIPAGSNQATFPGITYSTAETGVSLTATRTSGDNLTAATSSAFTVLATEPATQVATLTATTASATSVDLAWTGGDGESLIILAKQGAPVDADPIDGTTYTDDLNFGAGQEIGTGNYVVYTGNEASATITGLTANQEYHFAAYEFNGNGGTENYLLTPATADTSTCVAPTDATELAVTNFTARAITLEWANGGGQNRYVVMNTTGTFTPPANGADPPAADNTWNNAGEQIIYVGTGTTSATVTGLTPGGAYYFKIYEYNCSGAQAVYSTGSDVVNQSTALLVQGFGNCSLSGWQNITIGSGNGWQCGGGIATANNVGASGPVEAWLISPPVNMNLLANEALTFDNLTTGADAGEAYPQLTVWYSINYPGSGNPYGDGATWTLLNYDPSDSASGEWTSSGLVDLSAINSQVYIGFKYVASGIVEGSAATWQIDNVRIEDNVCGDPAQASGIVATDIQSTQITLSWTAGEGVGRIVVAEQGASISNEPVDGTSYTANSDFNLAGVISGNSRVVYSGTDNTVTITGLTSNQQYTFKVYEYNNCNGSTPNYNINSSTDNPVSVTTLDFNLSEIILDEGFSYTLNLDYAAHQASSGLIESNSLAVAGFSIAENASDGKSTTLNEITFAVTNHQYLRKIALFAGTTNVGEADAASEITFKDLVLEASDGEDTTFTLRATFANTVTDNEQIQFTVTSATVDSAGTLFIDAAAGGAQTPSTNGENTIEVTADSLEFTAIPGSWYVNVPFEVSVQAVDALGNVDLDETSNVSLQTTTGTGTLGNAGPQALSSGTATFSGVTYDAAETVDISTVSGFAAQATQGGVTFENALTFFDFTGYHAENDGNDNPAYYDPALYAPVFENGPEINTSSFPAENVFTAAGFDGAIVTPTEDYYLEFSLVPVESNTMSVTEIQFDVSRSPTGPTNLVLRSSVDDFSNYVESAVISVTETATSVFTPLSYTDTNDTITFRIYAYGGENGNGTIKIDNLVVLGSASDISSPTFSEGYPAVTNITTAGFTLNLNVTEPDTAYYLVQSSGTPPPANGEAVKTGATGSIVIGAAAVDSTVAITGLTASTAYDVYFALEDADGNLSEPIPLIGVVTANENSDITASDTPVAGGAIPSIADTEAEAVEVFAFNIVDNAGLPSDDTLATRVRTIVINEGTGNVADWTATIAGATIHNSAGAILTDSIIIDVSQMRFYITEGSLDIADNTSEEITLSIWLQNSVTDGQGFQFEIPIMHGFQTAAVNSSQLVENIGSAITSEVHSIQVTAMAVSFTNFPASVTPGANFAIAVAAVDENGNTDIDETSDVTLVKGSGSGTLSSGSGDLTGTPTSGIYSWNDIQYSQTDDFFTIIAQSTTLIDDTTGIITSGSPADLIVTTNQTISDTLTITGNVEIQATGNLTLEPGAVLNVGGNFINKGTFNDQGGTTLFNGGAAQTIDGSSVTTFYNLTISNTTGVTSGNTLQLVNTLKLNAGALFDADGAGDKSFTLLSTASNTARIAEIGDGATLSGNVTMQRYMGTGPSGWRFIATPIKNQHVTDWHPDDLTIQGTDISHPYHDQQLYTYNESKGTDGEDGADGWIGVTASNTVISGKALRLYLFNSSFGGGALTLDNTGAPFIGNGADATAGAGESHQVDLNFTSTAYDGGGWNLVANPYPSEIDWDEVASRFTEGGVGSAIYVWNPQIPNYGMYIPASEGSAAVGSNGVSQYIASGQSFFIKVTAPGQSITFQESDKSDQNGASFLRRSAPTDLLKIHVKANGKIHQDELIIRLNEDASDAFDLKYDAHEMASGWINLSSKDAHNTDLAINTLKKDKGIKVVPLSALPYYFGNYTMTFNELNTFNNGTKVYLRDNYLNKTELLSNKEKYNFAISKSAESSYENRFEIVFAEPVSFYLEAQSGKVGEEVLVYVKAGQFKDVAEAHMGISWNAEALAFAGIEEEGIASLTEADFDLTNVESGNLRLNWQDDQLHELADDATVFAIRFRIVANDDETTVHFDGSGFNIFSTGHIEFPVITKPDAVIDILRRGFVAGHVLTESGDEVEGVNIRIGGDLEGQVQSGAAGDYTFDLYENGQYTVQAFESSADPMEGINLLDVVKSRRYLAGIQPLENNYRIIAADVDGSKSIDEEDIEALKDVVLQRAQTLPLDRAWIFIPAVYDLSENPFNYDLSAPFDYADEVNIDFTGVKLGDVDLSYLQPVEASGTFNLQSREFNLDEGEEREVTFHVLKQTEILAYQLMISWDPAMADVLEVSAGSLNGRLGYHLLAPGKMLVIWEDGSGLPGRLSENAVVLSLAVRANRDIKSSLELFTFSTVESESLVVDSQFNVLKVAHTEVITGLESSDQPFVLLQNAPNPVKNATSIRFYLPVSEEVVFTVVNIVGEEVFEHRSRYKEGWNTFTWTPQLQSFIRAGQGVYLYSVKAGRHYAVKKMIVE